jgi:hypothetical protein
VVYRSGYRHAGPQQAFPVDTGAADYLVRELSRGVERRARVVVNVELASSFREDAMVQLGHGDSNEAVVEVQSEDDAGPGIETQEDRWPPAARPRGIPAVGRVGPLDHEPGVLKLPDQARYRRARQSGLASDLRAAYGAAFAHGLEHAKPVELAQRGK